MNTKYSLLAGYTMFREFLRSLFCTTVHIQRERIEMSVDFKPLEDAIAALEAKFVDSAAKDATIAKVTSERDEAQAQLVTAEAKVAELAAQVNAFGTVPAPVV